VGGVTFCGGEIGTVTGAGTDFCVSVGTTTLDGGGETGTEELTGEAVVGGEIGGKLTAGKTTGDEGGVLLRGVIFEGSTVVIVVVCTVETGVPDLITHGLECGGGDNQGDMLCAAG